MSIIHLYYVTYTFWRLVQCRKEEAKRENISLKREDKNKKKKRIKNCTWRTASFNVSFAMPRIKSPSRSLPIKFYESLRASSSSSSCGFPWVCDVFVHSYQNRGIFCDSCECLLIFLPFLLRGCGHWNTIVDTAKNKNIYTYVRSI